MAPKLIKAGLTILRIHLLPSAKLRVRRHAYGRVARLSLIFSVALLLSIFVPASMSQAAGNLSITRTINVTEDATLDSGAEDDNYGASTYLQVESKSEFHSILRTSLGSIIPTGSTVSSAALYLYYYDGNRDAPGRTHYVDRLTLTETDWVEGTSDGATEPGAVDWLHRQHDTLSWTSAGGTYDITDEATGTVPSAFGWMSITVTSIVQYAVTNGVNAEWVIRDPGTDVSNLDVLFYSSEGTSVPYISITFTAPWDSYEDTPPTTIRDTFNSSYQTVYMKSTGFPSGTYNVAYYDGGAAGGQKVTDNSTIVSGDGILNSEITLTGYPSAAPGTWHALVQPASGYSAFPSSYDNTVADPDTYGLLANDSFTVEQGALTNANPAVEAAGIYETDHSTLVTAMTPQTEYAIKVTVTDNSTLADLSTVEVTIFFDSDGDDDSADVPSSGDTQNAAVLTCNVGETPSWQIDPSTSTTWVLVEANCVQPTLTSTTGDFWFHFKPGKVATEALDWDAYAVADDGGGTAGVFYDGSDYDMNWYGEISVNTVNVTWGSTAPGTDFGPSTNQTGISVTYICNGTYYEQVAASSSWSGTSYNATLNAGGNPGAWEISLKADDTTNLTAAVLVTAAPTYVTIDNTGTQTGESGDTVTTNTLWLKLGTPFNEDTYSGIIYYRISQ